MLTIAIFCLLQHQSKSYGIAFNTCKNHAKQNPHFEYEETDQERLRHLLSHTACNWRSSTPMQGWEVCGTAVTTTAWMFVT